MVAKDQRILKTTVLPVDPHTPHPRVLKKVKAALENRGIVAYPTETLYGLGVDPFRKEALERLCQLKGRPEGVPTSVLVRDREMMAQLVSSVPPIAETIIEAFLPGPLTLVLKARQGLPLELTGGTGRIGIRISSHPLISHIFVYYPSPFTTTSANPTGLPPAKDARMVLGYFPEGISLLLDGGPVPGGVASTVVDLAGPEPVILRDGAISREELSRVLGGSKRTSRH